MLNEVLEELLKLYFGVLGMVLLGPSGGCGGSKTACMVVTGYVFFTCCALYSLCAFICVNFVLREYIEELHKILLKLFIFFILSHYLVLVLDVS
jgi:hypothetical protein